MKKERKQLLVKLLKQYKDSKVLKQAITFDKGDLQDMKHWIMINPNANKMPKIMRVTKKQIDVMTYHSAYGQDYFQKLFQQQYPQIKIKMIQKPKAFRDGYLTKLTYS